MANRISYFKQPRWPHSIAQLRASKPPGRSRRLQIRRPATADTVPCGSQLERLDGPWERSTWLFAGPWRVGAQLVRPAEESQDVVHGGAFARTPTRDQRP